MHEQQLTKQASRHEFRYHTYACVMLGPSGSTHPKEGDHKGGALGQKPSCCGASPAMVHNSAALRQEPVMGYRIQLQYIVWDVQPISQVAPAPARRLAVGVACTARPLHTKKRLHAVQHAKARPCHSSTERRSAIGRLQVTARACRLTRDLSNTLADVL